MTMSAWAVMAFQSRTSKDKPAASQCSRTSLVLEIRFLFLAISA